MHKQAGTQFARHRHSAIVGHYYSTVLMLSMLIGDLTFTRFHKIVLRLLYQGLTVAVEQCYL